ncbi:unnamed protein product [Auanema sp. JU1783]|nr:unnamed protein product [Auanema sp. JU1783]
MDSGKLVNAISMESINSVSTESTHSNNVRTLFVSGLPMDAKPRELYLLFRAYRGYESSLLKMTAKGGKPTSPVGFVTFTTRQDADEARKHLQGVRFDPDCAQQLRLELAKSNTKVSRPKQSPPPLAPAAAAPLQSIPQFLAPLQPAELVLDPNHQLLLDQQQLLALSQFASQAQAVQALQAYLPSTVQLAAASQSNIYAAVAAAQTNNTPACSTLFVANLASTVSEDELRTVFKAFPGFTRLRMHSKNGSSVAFVEYSDLRHASHAMLSLQGFQVSSADRGGLRIEYARNKMADVNG